MSLSLEDFAARLVETGDLDPIYAMLQRAKLPLAQRQRWCLGYWMFYHAGVASALSEMPGPAFWECVEESLSGDGQFPRGAERRHFRGKNAQASVTYLRSWFPQPESAAASLMRRYAGPGSWPLPYTEVARSVMQWVGFGPWIAFKVADMLDAILDVPVDFSAGFPGNIFEDPAKGAFIRYHAPTLMLQDIVAKFEETSAASRREITAHVFTELRGALASLPVPHKPGVTGLRIQEIETVLCKWKSHLHGRYPVGKDTAEIRHHLEGWGETAHRCQQVLG